MRTLEEKVKGTPVIKVHLLWIMNVDTKCHGHHSNRPTSDYVAIMANNVNACRENLNQKQTQASISQILPPQASIPTNPHSCISAHVLRSRKRLPALRGMFCVCSSSGIGTGLFHWLKLKRRAGEVTRPPDPVTLAVLTSGTGCISFCC